MYYNLYHNFAQGINKYLSITNNRKLNTAETQYLFNLWASNTGNNKITKKTQSIINAVNKQKHPQVCKESIKKTLQQFKQHGMITDYILSDDETTWYNKDKTPKKVTLRRDDKR
jgi:MinD-like ATPase involved in chromosome partitioning or flagellar assembly